MKSSFLAVTAVPKLLLLVNRDNDLYERAYQRALTRNKSQCQQSNPMLFQPSDDISLQHMVKEIKSRQSVVDMQNQLNDSRFRKVGFMRHQSNCSTV